MTQRADELDGLLAFYVNGTLTVEERSAVDAALDSDGDLRNALEETHEVYAEMQKEPLPHRVDTGFARLMKAIETTPQDPIPEQNPPLEKRAGSSLILRLALVASLTALLIQGALFWRGDLGVGLASGEAKGELTVAFQPGATEAEIRALLMELDLQIVSGPSSLGLYQLESTDKSSKLEALTARPDIVESAENAMD